MSASRQACFDPSLRTRFPVGVKLAVVLAVALVLRLAAGLWWQGRLGGRFGFGDSESYWVLGESIARGEAYQYGQSRVFRTPGYPVLLAGLFLFGDEPPVMWARGLGAVLGTAAVAAVWWLGRQLFDDRTALLAAAAAAVYPGAVAISALVLSEAPFCPLVVLNLVLWVAAWRARRLSHGGLLALGAGLVAGAATLVRPSWLLFTPFAAGAGFLLGIGARKRHAVLGAAMLAGLVLAMMPWWIRNAEVIGRFVPTTLQVGASLYDGLNPDATGASNMDFVPEFVAREKAEPTGPPDAPLEYRLDRRLRNAAVDWAVGHPGRVLELAAITFVRMWNIWPNEAAFSGWPIRLAVAGTYLPVLVLAGIGAWRTRRMGWPYVLLWLPAVYLTALHVVFVSSIRYRQPAMLPLCVLAAATIVHWRKPVPSPGVAA